MNRDEAEEYTQALGQVVAGGWRQVALGRRLGVPQALDISVSEWVEERLGGYVRLSIEERQQAVAELTAPTDEGGMGLSNVAAAEVLGVVESTVREDRKEPAKRRSRKREPKSEPQDHEQAHESRTREVEEENALLVQVIEASGRAGEIENSIVRSQYFSWRVSARRLFQLPAEQVGALLDVAEQKDARRLQQELNDWFATCVGQSNLRRLS